MKRLLCHAHPPGSCFQQLFQSIPETRSGWQSSDTSPCPFPAGQGLPVCLKIKGIDFLVKKF